MKLPALRKAITFIYLAAAVITVCFFVFKFSEQHLHDGFDREESYSLSTGWTLTSEDVTASVALPIKKEELRDLGVKGDFSLQRYLPIEVRDGTSLCVPAYDCKIDIWTDTKHIFQYDGAYGLGFVTTPYRAYMTVDLSAEDSGKLLTVDVVSPDGDPVSMREILIGDKADIFYYLSYEYLPWIISGVIMLVFGLFLFLSSRFSKYALPYRAIYRSLGTFSILIGLWELIRSGMSQLVDGNIAFSYWFSVFLVLMMPVSIIRHFSSVTQDRYQKAGVILVLADNIVMIFVGLMVLFFRANITVFVPLAWAMVGVAALYSITVLIMSLKNHREELLKFFWLLFGDAAIMVGATIQIVFNLLDIRGRGFPYLNASVIFFVCIMIWTHRINVEEDENKKIALRKALTKSDFLANMSHEIRTPVNSIIGLSSMMQKENNEDEITNYISDIKLAGRELKALVNKILISARIDSGREKPVASEYFMTDFTDALKMFSASLEKPGVVSCVKVSPSLPARLSGDMKKALDMCMYIIENAFKYTEEGAIVISVYTSEFRSDDTAEITVCIHDTGRGITEAQEEMLYQQFNTNNAEGAGAGLGLYIAGCYARMMDGYIRYESLADSGSLFFATFVHKVVPQENISVKEEPVPATPSETSAAPTAPEPVSASPETPAPEAAPETPVAAPVEEDTTKCILVVDDSDVNRMMAEAVAKHSGFETAAAASGPEAQAICREKKFYLILMDRFMPDMDGIETLHAIRDDAEGKNTATPCLMLTAEEGSDVIKESEENGFAGCLAKPLTKDALLTAVSSLDGKEAAV